MAVVVFLAMKNTPLAILTTYSYERLNSLHRAAGYTVLAQTIVHAVAYTQYFLSSSQPGKFSEKHIIAGIVLGFAVLGTVAVGFGLRRKSPFGVNPHKKYVQARLLTGPAFRCKL